MAETSLPMQSTYPDRLGRRTNWSAIWGGVFVFAAIWTVFESLALAIFGVPAAISTAGAGLAIWTIILTIIAMYVAGVETGRLAGVGTRRDGLVHGLMMFGLSIVSMIVLTVLWNVVFNYGAGANAHIAAAGTFTSAELWTGFLSLFLGWLAAMGGASSGVQRVSIETRQPVAVRPAA
jgi:hypothetical protein